MKVSTPLNLGSEKEKEKNQKKFMELFPENEFLKNGKLFFPEGIIFYKEKELLFFKEVYLKEKKYYKGLLKSFDNHSLVGKRVSGIVKVDNQGVALARAEAEADQDLFEKKIKNIDKMISLCMSSEFGRCRVTGQMIHPYRIWTAPFSTTSIGVKSGFTEKAVAIS